MLDENAAAIPVHCFGHCLNFTLQDAGQKLELIRKRLIRLGQGNMQSDSVLSQTFTFILHQSSIVN